MDLGRIYIIKNEVNNKVYIGKTIQKLENRWHDHLSKWSNCRKLKEAMDQLGRENFYIQILEDNIPYYDLDKKELYYISLYDSINNGYNLKNGNSEYKGRSTHKISKDIKARIKEDYLNGISPIDIAKHFKVGTTSIYNVLSENNIPKHYNKGGFHTGGKINLEELIQLKIEGKGTSYLSKYFNVCKSSIKRFVKLHKDIISPRVSDTLASKVEGKNVL